MSENKKAFKDWFDADAAKMMSAQMSAVYKDFNSRKFIRQATNQIQDLEFNARVMQFASALRATLPDSIPEALGILEKSLPDPLPDCEAVTDGWLQWPVGQFIASYCVDYPGQAWPVMVALTQRFSSEFAVRPFLESDPDWVLAGLRKLTQHESPHVRRWCSEGCRPCLPWGKKLQFILDNPELIIEILDDLKDDPELYVRKSVANHLNDFSRQNPKFVLETCGRWIAGADKSRMWMINHALRSLIKQGDSQALTLMGFTPPKQLIVHLKLSPKKLSIGESITITLDTTNQSAKPCSLLIDFSIGYVKKSGQVSHKVFKWKTLKLKKEESVQLVKQIGLKNNSVRTLFPGKHEVRILVNGTCLAKGSFLLSK